MISLSKSLALLDNKIKMNMNEFVVKANISPMMKKHLPITPDLLQKVDFIRVEYDEIPALKTLLVLLDASSQPSVTSEAKSVIKRDEDYKYLRHQQLLKLGSNRKLLQKVREKVLSIPPNGFLANDNVVFDDDALKKAVSLLLTRWHLSARYKYAIEELVIFNRIMPAMSGINWLTDTANGQQGLCWDSDASQKDIIAAINEDPLNLFGSTYLPAKKFSGKQFSSGEELMAMMARQTKPIEARPPRKPTKQAEKDMLTEEYEKLTGTQTHRIKQLYRKHPTLSESTIRKRIFGQ